MADDKRNVYIAIGLFLCVLAFLQYRSHISDGFPTDRSGTTQVLATIRQMNQTAQQYSSLVLTWYSAAYLARQMLPVSGIFAMNLIGGCLYGQVRGYLLCISLTLLGTMLTHLLTQLLLRHIFGLKGFGFGERQATKSPLKVAAMLNLQVGELTAGSQVTLTCTRQAQNNDELLIQTSVLVALRMPALVPCWLFNSLLAAAQFPLTPSLLSALLASIFSCWPGTFAELFLGPDQMALYKLEDMELVSRLIAVVCSLATMVIVMVVDSNHAMLIVQPAGSNERLSKEGTGD